MFVFKLFWSLGKLVEDEGEGEELEVCVKEQMEFDWAHTWLGMRDACTGGRQGPGVNLPGIFPSLPSLTPLLFDYGISFSPSCL